MIRSSGLTVGMWMVTCALAAMACKDGSSSSAAGGGSPALSWPTLDGHAVIVRQADQVTPPFLIELLKEMGLTVEEFNAEESDTIPSGALAIWLETGTGGGAASMTAVFRHLQHNGSALLALESGQSSYFIIEPLVGVEFKPTRLADEHSHGRRGGGVSDHGILVTDKVVDHPTTKSARALGAKLTFTDAGSLQVLGYGPGGKRTATIWSTDTTFIDTGLRPDYLRQDYEVERSHALAAAVEGAEGQRVSLFADASWLSDQDLRGNPVMQALLRDNLHWLTANKPAAKPADK